MLLLFGRSFIRRLGILVRPPRTATEPFDTPNILGLHVTEHIVIAVRSDYPKVGFSGRIPAVFHFSNLQDFLLQPKAQGPFVRSVARVALDLHCFHRASRSPTRFCRKPFPHSMPLPGKRLPWRSASRSSVR